MFVILPLLLRIVDFWLLKRDCNRRQHWISWYLHSQFIVILGGSLIMSKYFDEPQDFTDLRKISETFCRLLLCENPWYVVVRRLPFSNWVQIRPYVVCKSFLKNKNISGYNCVASDCVLIIKKCFNDLKRTNVFML